MAKFNAIMKNKKSSNPKSVEPSRAEEPLTKGYPNKITFFSSFEEMNEYDYKSYARFTPEEALTTVTEMRTRAYPHLNTSQNVWGSQVYFD